MKVKDIKTLIDGASDDMEVFYVERGKNPLTEVKTLDKGYVIISPLDENVEGIYIQGN